MANRSMRDVLRTFDHFLRISKQTEPASAKGNTKDIYMYINIYIMACLLVTYQPYKSQRFLPVIKKSVILHYIYRLYVILHIFDLALLLF